MKINIKISFVILMMAIVVMFNSCKDISTDDDSGISIPLPVPITAYHSPIWHPSGKFIGFNHTPIDSLHYVNGSKFPDKWKLDIDSSGFWLINSDGTNMRRIFPYTLQTPAWSPDGQWIAFVSGAQIFKMRFTGTTFDTTTLVQLTTEGRNFFPAWSPDGQWIAYDRSLPDESGTAGIWRMKSDGGSRQPVFGGSYPTWNPNGNILLSVIGVSPLTAGTRFVRYDVTQSKVIDTLSAVGNNNRSPRYSLDGTTIAFWSNNDVWVMDSVGNNKQRLTTSGVDVSFGLPFSWSPLGDKIVYTRYLSNDWTMKNGVLWMINVNTKTETQFTYNP